MIRRWSAQFNLMGLAGGLSIMALWELLVRTNILHYDYLPAPSRIASAFVDLCASGEMGSSLLHTLTAALSGWALAAFVGIIYGLALGLFWSVWRYSMASVELLRSLPTVAFVPVAVLMLGFSTRMEILVAFASALWPIVLNAQAGIESVDHRLLEVGRVLGLSRGTMLRKIYLPSSVPMILVGLRLGLAVSFILALVAEMVGAPAGLGYSLVHAQGALQPAQMFAFVVAIGLSGVVLNSLLVVLGRTFFRAQMLAAGDD